MTRKRAPRKRRRTRTGGFNGSESPRARRPNSKQRPEGKKRNGETEGRRKRQPPLRDVDFEAPESYDPISLLGIDSALAEESALGIGSRVVPPAMDFDEESADEYDVDEPEEPRLLPDVQEQIRMLEARLDGMIRDAHLPEERADEDRATDETPAIDDAPADDESLATHSASNATKPDARALPPSPRESEFYARQWGQGALSGRFEEVDEFGLDPVLEQKLRPLSEFLYRVYFRTRTEGVENIPADGRCVIVANHSGALPIDGAMLRTAVRLTHPNHRDLRFLAEDFVFYLPFIGTLLNRIGAVRACQENAERILNNEGICAVFPEGLKGIRKLYKERYKLQRFGRGGYIRLCLRTGAPLVPCAIVGAEESYPLLYRLDVLPNWLGLPYLPVTPTFPWLGPLGAVPAPAKWRIVFGEPLRLDTYGPGAERDHALVGTLSEQVRNSIRNLLDRALRDRHNPWLG